MNKALVIYDLTGKVLLVEFGTEDVPQGVPSLFVDVPDGVSVMRVDLTDPHNPIAILSEQKETDLDKINKKIADLDNNMVEANVKFFEMEKKSESIEEDITDTQMALAEVYEMLLGGLE